MVGDMYYDESGQGRPLWWVGTMQICTYLYPSLYRIENIGYYPYQVNTRFHIKTWRRAQIICMETSLFVIPKSNIYLGMPMGWGGDEFRYPMPTPIEKIHPHPHIQT